MEVWTCLYLSIAPVFFPDELKLLKTLDLPWTQYSRAVRSQPKVDDERRTIYIPYLQLI